MFKKCPKAFMMWLVNNHQHELKLIIPTKTGVRIKRVGAGLKSK